MIPKSGELPGAPPSSGLLVRSVLAGAAEAVIDAALRSSRQPGKRVADDAGIDPRHVGDQLRGIPYAADRQHPPQAEERVAPCAAAKPRLQLRGREHPQGLCMLVRT